MLIKSLHIKKFKGLKNFKCKFGPDKTMITGDNNQGKTSIAEAVAFVLYGINLAGSNKTDNLIPINEQKAEVSAEIEVIGRKHEVTRVRTKKGTKLSLNGIKITQAKLNEVIQQPEEDLFMAAFWPPYILTLPEKKAREFFMKLIKPVTPEEVLGQLDEPFKSYLKGKDLFDPEGLAKIVREENSKLEKEMYQIDGSIETLQETLAKEVSDEVDTTGIEDEIEKLKSTPGPEEPELEPVEELEEEIQKLRVQWTELRSRLKKYEFAAGDSCPTCGQEIQEKHVEKMAREIEKENQKIKEEMNEIVKKGKALEARLQEMTQKNAERKARYQESLQKYKNEIADKMEELYKKLNEAQSQNNMRSQLLKDQARAEEKIEKLKEKKKDNEKIIVYNKNILQSIAEYNAVRARMQSGQITKIFDRAGIELFRVVKTTGEIKPCFRLLYDGKPVEILSNSDRIRLGLEASNAVKKLAKVECPTFIDNAESITTYFKPQGQLFVARVVEGTDLEVR